MTSIIEDLETLAEKYKGLLHSLSPELAEQAESVPEALAQGDDLPSLDEHSF